MIAFWNDVILPALNGIVGDILGILPEVVGALTILLIGWIIARIVSGLVARLLKRVGFENIAEKAGIAAFLKRSGFSHDVSWVVGRLIFWALMLMFLLSAAEALKMNALADMLKGVVEYIPNLIVIVLVIIFGALVARLAGQLTRGSAASAGIDFSDLLGKLVSNAIMIAVGVIAISQLEIESAVLDYAFIALLAAAAIAAALTLGLGSRSIVRSIISGVYARKSFEIGQEVQLGDERGRLVQIGTVSAVIHTSDGNLVSVPNHELIEQHVRMFESG